MKTELVSVKEEVAWVGGKLDSFDKHITWLIALIAAASIIPQIIISWRDRKERVQEKQIDIIMGR